MAEHHRPNPENQPMGSTRTSELIRAYLDGPAQLRRVVSDLTAQQLQARPVTGRWSTMEVVCHLVDSEQAWCHRMKRVIAEERPLIIGYDESRFTATLAYDRHDLQEELALLDGMRRQMGRILSGLPESAWSRTCVHTERGLMTLEEMLRAEVDHIPHHMRHVLEKRKALGISS
jgi:uncharacterized damage-inducible protein DinB